MSVALLSSPEINNSIPDQQGVEFSDVKAPQPISDPTVLGYERILVESSDQLSQAGISLGEGKRGEAKERHARASLVQYGHSMGRYVEGRLIELGRDGNENLDIGQVVDEIDARVQQIYIQTLTQDGDVSRVSSLIDKLRLTRAGKIMGLVVGAGVGYGAGKIAATAIGDASSSAGNALQFASTMLASFSGKVLIGTTDKFTRDKLGDKIQDVLSPFGDDIIASVKELEEQAGRDFTLEEKVALARCAKVAQETDALRNDMQAYVGERFMNTENSEVADPMDISNGLTAITLRHLADLLDISDGEKPVLIRSFLGKIASETAGVALEGITGNKTIAGVAKTGIERSTK